ncbi:MAG: murein biosynthesis integral membrane protein MurJ [Myxococcales bacterium]|nr:murein biosynthesis integral membrane protein MurJ [Myxococcales bacterium]
MLVASGILLSRLAGLVRQRIFGQYLGISDAADAFTAALRIPNFLQNLFGEGILSGSFIPVYVKLLAEGDEEEAGRVASVVASLLALAVGVLTLVGVVGAPVIVAVVAPGFKGEVRELTVTLVRIMFPGVGLLVLAAWCLGVLNSHRRFFNSYVAPVLWNAAIIASLLIFGRSLAGTREGQFQLAVWVGWGTVVGAGLQLGLLAPTAIRLVGYRRRAESSESNVHRARSRLSPSLDTKSPAVRSVLGNFGPVVASRGVVQISAFIDQALATLIGSGANAAMAYAQTIYLVPVSLFGMSVSAAELPEMAGALGTPAEVAAKLRDRLGAALLRIAYFVVPSVVAFLALGDVVVAALFQTGAFGRHGTVFVWMILAGSTVGLLATTQSRLFSSAFYALRDTRTPLRFAIARVALTGVLGCVAAAGAIKGFWAVEFGAAGLTASAGLAGWIEFLLLRRALVAKIGVFPLGGSTLVQLWGAAAVAGAAAFGIRRLLPFEQPVLVGAIVLGVYGAMYLTFTIVLGIPEAKGLVRRLRRRR